MSNQLAVIESALKPLTPHFAEVLGKTGLAPERIIRTVLISMERLPALFDCTTQSIINGAMSAACLGLEVDGVTGQGFLIPFKQKAQLVIGYKGYNTMAARSGYTINGEVVREGDEFQYELGTSAFVRHVPKLGGQGRIIGAYALATSLDRPPIVGTPLSIQEIMAIKSKSPGAKKSDSPWNDEAIGFPAMAAKSAKRRLARAMPLNVMVLGARMEEAHEEQGLHSYIDPKKGVVIEGEIMPTRDSTPPKIDRPRYVLLSADGREVVKPTVEQWQGAVAMALQRMSSLEQLDRFVARHEEIFTQIAMEHPDPIAQIQGAVKDLREAFAMGG